MFELSVLQTLDAEVVHHYNPSLGDYIDSKGHRFRMRVNGRERTAVLPVPALKMPFLLSRLGRRAARLDKGNAVLSADRSCVLLIYQQRVYCYDLCAGALTHGATLRHSRNMLHRGILPVGQVGFLFGEYGHNRAGESVTVWRSDDCGRTTYSLFSFPPGKIRHVHGIYGDPFTAHVWTTTGDFPGECFLLMSDENFRDVLWLGDGSQRWRAVSLCFTPDEVIWIMDSPLEPVFAMRFDREEERVRKGAPFPGPVWYTKQLTDGLTLIATACEKGPGTETRDARLFVTKDFEDYIEVARYPKDAWPHRVFKHGVIAFADGAQTSTDFAMFGEALRGFDGVSMTASLREVV